MKKLFQTFIFTLISLTGISNVYIPSAPVINELAFDKDDHWYLEILYDIGYDEIYTFDSVIISTSSKYYRVHLPENDNYEKTLCILSDTLIGDSLTINPEGDSVHIECFGEYVSLLNYNGTDLIFGNYTNSTLNAPDNTQSICLFNDAYFFYTISIAPSIGEFNSAIGALGWIEGKVYDDQILIAKKYYFEWDFNFSCSTSGTFITTLKPGTHQLSKIGYYYSDGAFKWLNIEPINLSLDINDTIEADIHITDDSFVGITENINQPFILYPNPTSNTLYIKADFNQPVNYTILDINGHYILKGKAEFNHQLKIDLPSNMSAGVYILHLFNVNNEIYQQSFLVNSF